MASEILECQISANLPGAGTSGGKSINLHPGRGAGFPSIMLMEYRDVLEAREEVGGGTN